MTMIFASVVQSLKREVMNNLKDRTLALAGIFQTTTLVDQLASTGTCDAHSNEVSLQALVNTSSQVDEVFKADQDLSVGLSSLRGALGRKTKRMQNIVFYSLALISLEKKLMKDPVLVDSLSSEMSHIRQQDFFDISHSQSIARLGELYKDTLGGLTPKIMVSGEQLYLSNERTADHIRALLLAGIRAVSLWKSQGGKTWHLIFNKKKTLNFVNSMDF